MCVYIRPSACVHAEGMLRVKGVLVEGLYVGCLVTREWLRVVFHFLWLNTSAAAPGVCIVYYSKSTSATSQRVVAVLWYRQGLQLFSARLCTVRHVFQVPLHTICIHFISKTYGFWLLNAPWPIEPNPENENDIQNNDWTWFQFNVWMGSCKYSALKALAPTTNILYSL